MSLRHLLITLLFFVIAACTTQESLPIGSLSTPVADLPININFDNFPVQVTAVSDEIVQEADAEYILLSNIYERSTPGIVNVEADLPGGTSQNPNVSRGSGFVYDTSGHILTNTHVVQNSNTIRVTFNDGYVAEARLIGMDSYSDLAIIRVNTDNTRLQPLSLMANSDLVRVGQRAIAIGNPFGLSSSMTIGIVSGLGRNLRSAELLDENAPTGFQNPSIIQTDAPVNPGNKIGRAHV